MREKYELRWDGGGHGVIGIVYMPLQYQSAARRVDPSLVLVGGPARFEDQIREALSMFRRPDGDVRAVLRVYASKSKVKLALCDVTPEIWERGLKRLRTAGFTTKRVQAFRRLMN